MAKHQKKKIVAIIPARGGSKGISRKNIRLLDGKPLIQHSIDVAVNANDIDRVIVSTEDREIESISIQLGAEVVKRPMDLARDATPTEPVMLHVVKVLEHEGYVPDFVVLLQPTSPLRSTQDIGKAVDKIIREKSDSLFSVVPHKHFIWKKSAGELKPLNYNYNKRPRRQDRKQEFRENGSIYITKLEILKKKKNRLGGKISYYLMDEDKSYEIDTETDWLILETLLSKRRKNESR